METAIEYPPSVHELSSAHTEEEMQAIFNDLDKKISIRKEAKTNNEAMLDEMRQESEQVKTDRETIQAQLKATNKRVTSMEEKFSVAKTEKEAIEQARRQKAEAKRNSNMTPAKAQELRERLTKQRDAINEAEEAIERLKVEKTDAQANVVEVRSALKAAKADVGMHAKEHGDLVERRDYLQGVYQSLCKTVEELKQDVSRIEAKLAAPVPSEPDRARTLFDEVLAEKKTLETDYTDVMGITNSLRDHIRQMYDELDELQGHENEDIGKVDIEHVLQKLKTLVNENTKICIVLKKVDEDLKMRKKDVDDWLRTNDRDYAVKYATLREYDIGAEDGCAKVASDFYKLEQLAAESAKLQEEKWNQ